MGKSPLEKLMQIDKLIPKIEERLKQLGLEGDLGHVPNPESKHVLDQCVADCPACAVIQKYLRRRRLIFRFQKDALRGNARNTLKKKQDRSVHSSGPRKRAPHLWQRGFSRVIQNHPEISAKDLRALLGEKELTYDTYGEEYIELRLNGDDIVVESFDKNEIVTVAKRNQREYLRRARNR